MNNARRYLIDSTYGVLRQKQLLVETKYDADYIKQRYEQYPTTHSMSQLRLGFIKEFIPNTDPYMLLDFGCGTGDFVACVNEDKSFQAYGYDITSYHTHCPQLKWNEIKKGQFGIVTFFDSLEHLPDPFNTIKYLNCKYLVISVPECHFPFSESWFDSWKHRRPGEHLWHFNRESLDCALSKLNYKRIVHSNFEDKIRTPYSPYLPNILSGIYELQH